MNHRGHRVAVKVLSNFKNSPEQFAEFAMEFRSYFRVQGKYVARVYGTVGHTPMGSPGLVMDLYDDSLRNRIPTGGYVSSFSLSSHELQLHSY